jgi:adenylate kinase
LDGYPRTIDQAKALDNFCKVDVVIHIDVDIDVLVGRITGRRVCQECGGNFHLEFAKPSVEGTCDKCGGNLVQRPDDTEGKVRVRLDVYEKSTKPVIDFYRDQGLYRRVDGMASPTNVYQELKDILVPMFNTR